MSSPRFPLLPASFVHLTPFNSEARQAFNDVAVLVKNLDSTTPSIPDVRHPAKFMVIEACVGSESSQHRQQPVLPLSEVGNGSDTFDSSPLPDSEVRQYQGFYDLSFGNLPDIPRNGWLAGIGRWNSDNRAFTKLGFVDLMLAPSHGKKLYNVRGKHAMFYFDATGSLCIKSPPGTSIFLGTEEFSSGSRIISARSQIVSFGNLTYCLEYVDTDKDAYQSNLKAFYELYLSRPAPPPDMSATPSPWDITIDDWICKGTAGAGGFGTVSAAKHRVTGETAAAKTIIRKSKTMRDIADEIFILKHLPKHPQLLAQRGVYYERGDSWFTSPDNEDDERYGAPARPERVILIVQPFARLTLTELLPKLTAQLKLIVFHQILQGVYALHIANPFPFVHRDLKLSNVGVVSYSDDNITVVILDYGQTIQAQPNSQIGGKAGTPGYQAPEMFQKIHGQPLDIWSCGIIGLRMFVPEWVFACTNPVQAEFRRGVEMLQSRGSTTPEHLIAQMLIWESDKRISASDILLHDCFTTLVKAQTSPQLSAGKRRREGN